MKLFHAIILTAALLLSPTTQAYAVSATDPAPTGCQESVLSNGSSDSIQVCSNTTITNYVSQILTEYRALILTIMTLYVAASGVQYMLSQGKADAQKAAKQRILAMVTGIIFFTLINLIASTLGGVR